MRRIKLSKHSRSPHIYLPFLSHGCRKLPCSHLDYLIKIKLGHKHHDSCITSVIPQLPRCIAPTAKYLPLSGKHKRVINPALHLCHLITHVDSLREKPILFAALAELPAEA